MLTKNFGSIDRSWLAINYAIAFLNSITLFSSSSTSSLECLHSQWHYSIGVSPKRQHPDTHTQTFNGVVPIVVPAVWHSVWDAYCTNDIISSTHLPLNHTLTYGFTLPFVLMLHMWFILIDDGDEEDDENKKRTIIIWVTMCSNGKLLNGTQLVMRICDVQYEIK